MDCAALDGFLPRGDCGPWIEAFLWLYYSTVCYRLRAKLVVGL